MAPPPESQLLWVNKDVKSYKQSKRVSATQASIINAHSQQQARAARIIANQRALREGSAVRAVLGWRQQKVSAASSDSTPENQSADDHKSRSTKDSEQKLKKVEFTARRSSTDPSAQLVPYIPRVCGKDEALDPFNCTAAKIDSNMHDLIEFFLARLHASSWNAKPQGAHGSPDIESIEVVTECIADKARFFSLIACTAAYRESIEEEDQNGRSAIYLGQALAAIREQVQRKDFVKKDSLHSIINMAICAELLGDYAASLAHLRAAKFLVDQEGGVDSLLNPSQIFIFKLIVRADVGLALKTLSSPIFTCPFKPATVQLPEDKLDILLERHACSALAGAAKVTLPTDLHEDVCHIIECARMLHYAWSYPGESEATIRQLGGSITAIFYHLLSLSFEDHTSARKKLEATRISLVIWAFLMSQSLFNNSQSSKDHIPVFSQASLDARKQLLPSNVYFLLKDWNHAVQSSEDKINTIEGCTSIRLIRIVQAIERETDVKLGAVMERLFEIEAWYRTGSKFSISGDQRCQVQRQLLSTVRLYNRPLL